jgi:hypothetical protein
MIGNSHSDFSVIPVSGKWPSLEDKIHIIITSFPEYPNDIVTL